MVGPNDFADIDALLAKKADEYRRSGLRVLKVPHAHDLPFGLRECLAKYPTFLGAVLTVDYTPMIEIIS